MRDKYGKKLLPVWKVSGGGGLICAWTKEEALMLMKRGWLGPNEVTRIKGVAATGEPRIIIL